MTSSHPDAAPAELWELVWAHRPRLLAIARRRLDRREDAEDVVADALIRCVTYEPLDRARVGEFLTTLTINRCMDMRRLQARAGRCAARASGDDRTIPRPDEVALDAHEARYLRDAVQRRLTGMEAAVLERIVDGQPLGQAASDLGITYKMAEHNLARARGRLRRLAARVVIFVVGVRGGWRRRAELTAGGMATVAATVALLVPVAPHAGPAPGEQPGVGGGRAVPSVAVAHHSPASVATARRAGPSPGARDRTAPSSRPTPRADVERVVVPGTPPNGVVTWAGGEGHLDKSEPIGERLDRCARNGVTVDITTERADIVCRDNAP